MKCPICGKDLDLQNKQIGTSENGDPIFNEYAICHSCKKQWNLDKQRAKKIAAKKAAEEKARAEAAAEAERQAAAKAAEEEKAQNTEDASSDSSYEDTDNSSSDSSSEDAGDNYDDYGGYYRIFQQFYKFRCGCRGRGCGGRRGTGWWRIRRYR